MSSFKKCRLRLQMWIWFWWSKGDISCDLKENEIKYAEMLGNNSWWIYLEALASFDSKEDEVTEIMNFYFQTSKNIEMQF